MTRSWHGRCREGLELGSEGLRIAREHRLLIPLIRCLWSQGVAWIGLGEYEAALAPLREGAALTEKIGDEAYLARFLNTLAWLYVGCGDLDRGLELSAPAEEVARKRRHATGGEQLSFTQVNQGDAQIAKGDLVAAGEVLEEVHRFATNPTTHEWMKWRYSTHCFASLGDLWLARGDPARAEVFADQCLEIATPTTSRRYVIRGFRVKGRSMLLRRRWDEAEAALSQALAIAESIGEPREIWTPLAASWRPLAGARIGLDGTTRGPGR